MTANDPNDPDDTDKPITTNLEAGPEPDTTRLQAQVMGHMQRLSGRCYQVALERLDHRSLMELIRFLRDVEHDRDAALRRARLEPWRGW